MSVGYEEVETMLEQIFASRLKNVSPKHLAVWINEIVKKGYQKESLEKTQEEYLEDESLELNLPTMLKTLNKYNPTKAVKGLNSCKYCEGRGFVYNNLKFANNGDFVSYNYALACYCNKNETDILKFTLNEETNNKTITKDGYYLVFKDCVDYWAYLDKVYANDSKDLWVKTETDEVEPAQQPATPEPANLPEQEEIIDDELLDEESIPF